jgi:NADH-quinone oxidoreductase subunit N
MDALGLLFCALFALAAAVTVLLSLDYMRCHGDEPEEYFLLLVLSTLGACVLACANHLASLLLGLELMSIALYALIAYPNRSLLPLEAASKYLVLSGAASATFAILYAATGSLAFPELGARLLALPANDPMLLVGAAMVFAGLAFKLSVVPFHLWTPDVYAGAPAPITGFLASVGKAAVLLVLLRLFIDADLFRYRILVELTGLMAILSMLAGNLLALLQTNIKRMLAYLLPGGLHCHHYRRFRPAYPDQCQAGRARERGTSPCEWPVLEFAAAGGADAGGPAFPGGHSPDRRIHRQILYIQFPWRAFP